MSHPCDRYSCPECVQGECFGEGCETNPVRRDDEDYDYEDESEVNK